MFFLVVCCYLRNHNLKAIFIYFYIEWKGLLLLHSTHFTFCWFHSWILCMVIIIVNIRAQHNFRNFFLSFATIWYTYMYIFFFILQTFPIHISPLYVFPRAKFSWKCFCFIFIRPLFQQNCFGDGWKVIHVWENICRIVVI